jgi:hypothetical protein
MQPDDDRLPRAALPRLPRIDGPSPAATMPVIGRIH